jgi:hypothetical protein
VGAWLGIAVLDEKGSAKAGTGKGMPSEIPIIAAVTIEASFVAMVMSNSIPCSSDIISSFNNATKLHLRTNQ